MEINVQGRGSEYITPDEVIMNIEFSAKGKTYDEALIKGMIQVQNFINELVIKNGFNKEDLKTRNIIIQEDQKYDETTRQYIFQGYLFKQNAILQFDYAKELMAIIIEDLAQITNPPVCQFNFGIKEEQAWRQKILAKAYHDAELQAQTIADASGKILKQCLKVDYKPFANDYLSGSQLQSKEMYNALSRDSLASKFVNTFTPEDIELSETLSCLWLAE